MRWVLEGGGNPLGFQPLWLLAHCDAGLVWGYWDDGWLLSSGLFDNSPPLEGASLQQLRLFSREAEVWLGPRALRGRWLSDLKSYPEAMAPLEEIRLLAIPTGSPLQQELFSRVRDRSGRGVILPPIRNGGNWVAGASKLRIKHYLEKEPSGALRIAASRLLEVV
jgi:hypothetical protein